MRDPAVWSRSNVLAVVQHLGSIHCVWLLKRYISSVKHRNYIAEENFQKMLNFNFFESLLPYIPSIFVSETKYKLWETLHVELWPRRWITTETLHHNQKAGLCASTGIFFKQKIKHFYWKVLSYELCDSQGLCLALHKNSSVRVQKNSAREIWRAFPKNLGARYLRIGNVIFKSASHLLESHNQIP